ncbi:MAG: nicotinate (nicotinamide) nucleotide adenylyltransferase [Clostridia bacterium]|nr:nicotinate (nicotinamide) nucleotide adenylyltransferase [Clostridia bacterium]
MRIAVFGGSFDPVHTEHVRLVEAAIKELGLDKLFVMPAFAPPHKLGKALSADKDRLEMCRLAFRGVKKAEVSDYEIAKGGTSYTYLTCQYFRAQYPGAEIFWIVGTDMLRDFPTWKNPDDILENVTLAVCGRAEEDNEWWKEEQPKFFARFGKKFRSFTYNGAAVSSTKIRVLVGAGMDLTPFVDKKVAECIQTKELYLIPNAKAALALENPKRQGHSLRVAELAASRAVKLGISEKQAIAAALFHDCAKNLSASSPYLRGFALPTEWGDVPTEVAHQFAGAYVAETYFGVTDGDLLNAVRYHTSARPNMSELEKLIFLADMLEEERHYEGVDELRTLFWSEKDLDKCLAEALYQTLLFLEKKGGEIYPLTKAAYDFYAEKR